MPDEIETPEVKPSETQVRQIELKRLTEEDLEAARQQERNKLFSKLEKEAEKAQRAELEVKELKDSLKELEKFKESIELEKLSDIQKLEAQIIKLTENLSKQEAEAARREEKLQNKIKIFELDSFRLRRIKETGLDPDFEDFVKGETEEEIENSLKKAQEKEKKFKEKYTKTEPPKSPKASNPGGARPGTEEDVHIDLDKIKSMEELTEAKRRLGIR